MFSAICRRWCWYGYDLVHFEYLLQHVDGMVTLLLVRFVAVHITLVTLPS
jgi:hypothetical protein